MWTACRLAVVGVILSMGPAAAQGNAVELPLVKDRLPLEGYGTSKADVLGIRFGEGRADTIALLKKSFPEGKLAEISADIMISDNHGNSVSVAYPHTIQLTAMSDQASEDIRILFSSALTGGRVVEIERNIRYMGSSLGDMATLRAGIQEKFGDATVVERYDHQNHIDITYTWEKRPIKRFGEQDVRKRSFTDMGPSAQNRCINIAGLSAYASATSKLYGYVAPGSRKGNPGTDACIGAMRFNIYFGKNPQTVSGMRVIATDYERSMIDARLLDETLTRMIAEKAKNVKGTAGAPKL